VPTKTRKTPEILHHKVQSAVVAKLLSQADALCGARPDERKVKLFSGKRQNPLDAVRVVCLHQMPPILANTIPLPFKLTRQSVDTQLKRYGRRDEVISPRLVRRKAQLDSRAGGGLLQKRRGMCAHIKESLCAPAMHGTQSFGAVLLNQPLDVDDGGHDPN